MADSRSKNLFVAGFGLLLLGLIAFAVGRSFFVASGSIDYFWFLIGAICFFGWWIPVLAGVILIGISVIRSFKG